METRKLRSTDTEFDEVAKFIHDKFDDSIKYIADITSEQGILSRILNKKYNYESEVIDPSHSQIVGVPFRECEYNSSMADYYDLIVGLHVDKQTREIVNSAKIRPILIIPSGEHLDKENKLGTNELISAICNWLDKENIKYEKIEFNFKGPKNIGILTYR